MLDKYLKCVQCGWTGDKEEAYHFNEEEIEALVRVIYAAMYILGKINPVRNLKEFLMKGGHICPKCDSRFVLDTRDYSDHNSNTDLNLVRNYGNRT